MKSVRVINITSVLIAALSPVVFAQTPDEAAGVLARRLQTGDRVWVKTDASVIRAGRVLDVTPTALRITADGREEPIPLDTIRRVERKRNGVLLGTLIGAGAGFALGLPVAAIAANEGAAVASPLLFFTAVGAGAGAGLDALLSVKRTVYLRQQPALSVRANVTRDRAALLVVKTF